jgi:hypothetical protein
LFVLLAGDFFHADEVARKGYRKPLGGGNPRVVTSERGRRGWREWAGEKGLGKKKTARPKPRRLE